MSDHGTQQRYRSGCKCRDCRAAAAAYANAHPSTPEQRQKAQSAYRKRHPEKHAAQQRVYRAKKRGEIVPASECEACKTTTTTEASHTDYSKPLDIEWLCRPCHLEKDLGYVR